jgi:hypothetical protein
MKNRNILSIEVTREDRINIENQAVLINKESISAYCRRKLFAPTETPVINSAETREHKENENLKKENEKLKTGLAELQTGKSDCEKIITDQIKEIEKLNSIIVRLKNVFQYRMANSSNQVKVLRRELEEMKALTFVNDDDIYIPLPHDARLVADCAAKLHGEHWEEDVKYKRVEDFIRQEIYYIVEKTRKHYPNDFKELPDRKGYTFKDFYTELGL